MWHEIEARGSVRMTAAEPRQRYPPARPKAMAVERFIGIGGAGRKMPTVESDQGREGIAIGGNQSAPYKAWCSADTARTIRQRCSASVPGPVPQRFHRILLASAEIEEVPSLSKRQKRVPFNQSLGWTGLTAPITKRAGDGHSDSTGAYKPGRPNGHRSGSTGRLACDALSVRSRLRPH